MQASHPGTGEVEAEGSEAQDHLWLHRELEATGLHETLLINTQTFTGETPPGLRALAVLEEDPASTW